jgi:hypothetical protein
VIPAFLKGKETMIDCLSLDRQSCVYTQAAPYLYGTY